MLIKETYLEDKHYEGSGYNITVESKNGYKTLTFLDGEPEYATINRDFSDIHKIYALVKLAYEAGKNGETITSISTETDDVNELC